MDKKIIEQWKKAAFELAPDLKKDQDIKTPNIYSYMVYSAFTLIELYFTAVDSISKEDFQFTTKSKFYGNMQRLSKREMKSLYVFFLLDYFGFLKYEMDAKYFSHFPATYEEILLGFKNAFKDYPNELQHLDEVLAKYEFPYHPRTFLRRCGLPIEQEDLILLETLNEMKFQLFHQFNKNIIRYLKNTPFRFSQ